MQPLELLKTRCATVHGIPIACSLLRRCSVFVGSRRAVTDKVPRLCRRATEPWRSGSWLSTPWLQALNQAFERWCIHLPTDIMWAGACTCNLSTSAAVFMHHSLHAHEGRRALWPLTRCAAYSSCSFPCLCSNHQPPHRACSSRLCLLHCPPRLQINEGRTIGMGTALRQVLQEGGVRQLFRGGLPEIVGELGEVHNTEVPCHTECWR